MAQCVWYERFSVAVGSCTGDRQGIGISQIVVDRFRGWEDCVQFVVNLHNFAKIFFT